MTQPRPPQAGEAQSGDDARQRDYGIGARCVGCCWPVQPKLCVLVLRRALLTLQVNPGSLYRCGKSDYEQAASHGRRKGP